MKQPRNTYARQLSLSLFGDEEPDEMPALRPADPDAEPLLFISLGSGSSGNSAFIGTRRRGMVIDAGVKPDVVESVLASRGIEMRAVTALLLTHDHSDHVRFAYTLLRGHKHIRVYCTNRVLSAILRRHSISKRIKDYHTPIFKEIPFRAAGFEVTAFDVPHDSEDAVGFFLSRGPHTFAVATDMGAVSPRADWYMRRASHIMIEANYDSDMLRLGSYPEYLKSRIRSGRGHMDNSDTASYLEAMAAPGLRHVFLCHLSQDNNRPELAVKAVSDALRRRGFVTSDTEPADADAGAAPFICLAALPRFDASRTYVLRP